MYYMLLLFPHGCDNWYLSRRKIPVIFSCGHKTGHIAQDSTSALNDGQGVGLTSVGERADQESQSSIY